MNAIFTTEQLRWIGDHAALLGFLTVAAIAAASRSPMLTCNIDFRRTAGKDS